jgi:hypothetical protein
MIGQVGNRAGEATALKQLKTQAATCPVSATAAKELLPKTSLRSRHAQSAEALFQHGILLLFQGEIVCRRSTISGQEKAWKKQSLRAAGPETIGFMD